VLVDRVNTTATVWLGRRWRARSATTTSTIRSPRGTTSAFSPSSPTATSRADVRRRHRYFEPTLDLATPDQEAARKELQAKIDQLDQELKRVTPAIREAQERWEESIRSADRAWTALSPRTVAATNGVVLNALPDGSVLASGANPPFTSYTVTADTTLQGITGVRLEALPDPSLPRGGPGRDAYGHFRVTGIHVDVAPVSIQPSRLARFDSRRSK
jgi:hypothetical protein